MPEYRLAFRMSHDETPRTVALDAADEGMARIAAGPLIAQALERPEAMVVFDPIDGEDGRFTVGAGFWSRRGFYEFIVGPAGGAGQGAEPAAGA